MLRAVHLSSLVLVSAGCSLVSLDDLDAGGAGGAGSSTTTTPATISSSSGAGGDGAGGPGPGGGGQGAGGRGAGGPGGGGGSGGHAGGGGGDGGGGGSSPGDPCGTVSLATDDFTEPFEEHRWYRSDGVVWDAPGVTITPDGTSDDYDQLASRHRFDLRNDAVTAVVTAVTEQDGDLTTSVLLLANGKDDVTIEARDGQLRAGLFVDGEYSQVGATPYVGQTHWRIGHDGRDFVFEASTDGATFAEIARVAEADAFVPSQVDVELITATFGAVPEPGRMEVEAVLGAIAAPVACPLASLVDDFDTAGIAAVWEEYSEGSCTAVETGGELTMSLASGTGYCSYRSFPLLDLRGSEVVLRSTSLPAGPSGAEGYVELRDRAGRGVVAVSTGPRFLVLGRDPASTTIVDVAYDRAAEPWWRIREEAGTIRVELSPDGVDFRGVAQLPVDFEAEATELIVAGSIYEAQGGPTTIAWDDLNTPP